MVKRDFQPIRRKRRWRKGAAILSALLMLAVSSSSVGGTLAYLKQTTPEMTNTFELGNLQYALTYAANPPDGAGEAKGMPGNSNTEANTSSYSFTCDAAPTLEGYVFRGWANDSASDSADWTCGENGEAISIPLVYGTDAYENGVISKTVYAVWEAAAISISIELPGVSTDGSEPATAGKDYTLTLTGSVPDILKIRINGTLYMTGTNLELLNACANAESATAKPEWLAVNGNGGMTLTIPGERMTGGAEIVITGENYTAYDLNDITYDDLAD